MTSITSRPTSADDIIADYDQERLAYRLTGRLALAVGVVAGLSLLALCWLFRPIAIVVLMAFGVSPFRAVVHTPLLRPSTLLFGHGKLVDVNTHRAILLLFLTPIPLGAGAALLGGAGHINRLMWRTRVASL